MIFHAIDDFFHLRILYLGIKLNNNSKSFVFFLTNSNSRFAKEKLLLKILLLFRVEKDVLMRILFICPHASTGGSIQFTYNRLELLKDSNELKLIEFNNHGDAFVVQKNRIKNLIGEDNFHTFHGEGNDKKNQLQQILDDFSPEIVMVEEFPEFFAPDEVIDLLYNKERTYKILETTHDSSFPLESKKVLPDKFLFVSPYSAMRALDWGVPFEIIEYPVEKKTRDKALAQKELGFDPSYKHVVMLGLFTERKNQKYAFQIAGFLKKHKILFHFVGNQAINFADYWKPIMKYKPENCIIHGERSDTEKFLQAADVFFFPSKGNRGNKELLPLVLKEAQEYSLPILQFNLDVYMNKFHNDPMVKYLSGDINTDISLLLESSGLTCHRWLSPKNDKELIIIGTYPNTKERERLTKECIESHKAAGRRVMLVSHLAVPKYITDLVDIFLLDVKNEMTYHSYYTRFFNKTDEYDADININVLKDTNQSFAVLTNIYNSFRLAKSYGYTSVFYNTYDVLLHPQDLPIIEHGFSKVANGGAYLGTLATPFERGIQTNGMFFNLKFFFSEFSVINGVGAYNFECTRIGSQNFLEDYMMKVVQGRGGYELVHNPEETLLINSGLGVSSHSEYYSILPVEGEEGMYMAYFYTYNRDNRVVELIVKEGEAATHAKYRLSERHTFRHPIKFTGQEIEVEFLFYDDDKVYKNDRFVINQENLGLYLKAGLFKDNRKPKIKLVHLQTTMGLSKENESRESLSKIGELGIEYVLHQNPVYLSLPPKHNCLRPIAVNSTLFTEDELREKMTTALTPAHYGCYESFKNGILREFDDDLDFLLLAEGDCLLEVSAEQFVEDVYKACQTIKGTDIGYFSFGDTHTLDTRCLQSPTIRDLGDIITTNKIIGLQMIMFPKKTRKWLKDTVVTHKWDCADLFFNTIFNGSPYEMAILKKRITTQVDGVSIIDQTIKKFDK